MSEDRVLVGSGRLSWSPDERRTGRYGMVTLKTALDNGSTVGPDPRLAGRRGSLVAEVVQVSTDNRDPVEWRASAGELLVLGSGTVLVDKVWYEVTGIGVRPDDGRDEGWMDERQLYRASAQAEVRLWFVPES